MSISAKLLAINKDRENSCTLLFSVSLPIEIVLWSWVQSSLQERPPPMKLKSNKSIYCNGMFTRQAKENRQYYNQNTSKLGHTDWPRQEKKTLPLPLHLLLLLLLFFLNNTDTVSILLGIDITKAIGLILWRRRLFNRFIEIVFWINQRSIWMASTHEVTVGIVINEINYRQWPLSVALFD